MELETQPPPLTDWLSEALLAWLAVCGVVTVVVLAFTWLRIVVLHGQHRSGRQLVESAAAAWRDVARLSPGRVYALARLTVQESLRRRAMAGVGLFVLILVFALWFLDSESIDPAALYTSFVLSATNYLVLAIVLLLAVFALPGDLETETIQTILTKPVRTSELVLGRLLGFVAVGTAMLALMGVAGYIFIVRALDHTHTLVAPTRHDFASTADTDARTLLGQTSLEMGHRHNVVEAADGRVRADRAQGHYHDVDLLHERIDHYEVGHPRGQFHARVPIFGELRFKDRVGADARSGVNVGNEWTYRSYVEGGGLAAAVWRFSGISRERFPDGLPFDLTIRVFRTYKGEIERGVLGSLVLRNPRTKRTSAARDFLAREYAVDRQFIPRQLTDADGHAIDLFDVLVSDGEIEVQLSCLEKGQFFGMAQGDLYLLAREASVPLNFVKGYLGIWLQMLLVAAVGVMWSTLVSGPVAMLTTLGTLAAGFFRPFIEQLAAGKLTGGGTFESLLRIVQNKSTVAQLEQTWGTQLAQTLDVGVRWIMSALARLLPDFGALGNIAYVSAGFDVPAGHVAVELLTALGYLAAIFALAVVCFRSREVAQ